MKNLLLLLALITAFSSCHTISDLQIEKRHYRKGYYVHVRPHRYTEPIAFVQPERVPVERTQTAEAEKPASAPVQKTDQPIAESTAPVAVSESQETRSSNPANSEDYAAPRSVKPAAQQNAPVQSAAPVSKSYFQNYDAGKSIPSKLDH